jgi:uncharacterized protein YbjT (DUF2867 family)
VKTLVIGGSGFVGLNVAEELLSRAHEVIALSNAAFPTYALRV